MASIAHAGTNGIANGTLEPALALGTERASELLLQKVKTSRYRQRSHKGSTYLIERTTAAPAASQGEGSECNAERPDPFSSVLARLLFNAWDELSRKGWRGGKLSLKLRS